MLLRAYRLTDKSGSAFLKLWLLVIGHLLRAATLVVGSLSRILNGLLAIVFGLWLVIYRGVRLLASGLWRIIRFVFGGALGVGRVAGLGGQRVTVAAVGAASASGTSVMARRAARAEMQGDIQEDPLRRQNRLLSGVAVLLLGVLILVVLWATNPANQSTTTISGAGEQSIALGDGVGTVAPTVNAPLLPSPVPSATLLPEVLEARGSIAYVVREDGQQDIWALNIGSRSPLRLTNNPEDERDPAWSPDGQRLAFASRQDGNWEIYIYDLATATTTRITYDLSFQARPQWSPDGTVLAYESYQGDNLDIYIVPVDGSQPAVAVTTNTAPDFAPVWAPDFRRIAFVSWRDGNQDIYIFSLDNPSDAASVNLTNTPARQESFPAWSPDGRFIAYSALDGGIEKIFIKSVENLAEPAQVFAQGRMPAWSPDGNSLIYAVESLEGTQFVASPLNGTDVATLVIGAAPRSETPAWSSRPLPIALVNSGGLPSSVPQSLFVERVDNPDPNGLFGLDTILSVEVSRSQGPFLSDRVNDSFIGLRETVNGQGGWDFLGRIDDAFWALDRLPEPGEERRNWYMTGRAFGISRNLTAGFPPQIELVREDSTIETYWRVYIRVDDAAQNGNLGEPLRTMPWDMLSRDSGDLQAYDAGGRLKSEIPSGYYIDFTELAQDYGWLRAPAGSDWRANFNSINYWLFLKTDNLSWYDAMRELYTEAQLGGFAPTPTPVVAASQP
jgi:TolB protein